MLTPNGSLNQLCWTLTDPWPFYVMVSSISYYVVDAALLSFKSNELFHLWHCLIMTSFKTLQAERTRGVCFFVSLAPCIASIVNQSLFKVIIFWMKCYTLSKLTYRDVGVWQLMGSYSIFIVSTHAQSHQASLSFVLPYARIWIQIVQNDIEFCIQIGEYIASERHKVPFITKLVTALWQDTCQHAII